MSFPEEKIWNEINEGWSRMSFRERFLWETIKRPPEEWEVPEYGKFWVVALIGSKVIYFNHHEHGFNRSPWHRYGYIDAYESLQYGLEMAIQAQLEIINTGYDIAPSRSPPIPGEYQKP
ncbi:hypothetical protein HB779_14400 [Phyllobacterium sp. 628]|uniref:hypothetical protein n=1 Tax=Phyllobacterium sp. 628 TaxID=2718938 RepID=UPI0016622932|nr:hypothetical protein [Phyllobacterium sp. 628]QND52957.1 hypothetical protein HB779_14400 [Phyllobacterium sp. 628]